MYSVFNLAYDGTIEHLEGTPIGNLPLPAPNGLQIISVGDMHGSAFKFVCVLCALGIIRTNQPADREALIDFIVMYKNISRGHLGVFNRDILTQLVFQNPFAMNPDPTKIILLGDILSDRGLSDYLTLYLFNRVLDVGVDIEWIYGNHDYIGTMSFSFTNPFPIPAAIPTPAPAAAALAMPAPQPHKTNALHAQDLLVIRPIIHNIPPVPPPFSNLNNEYNVTFDDTLAGHLIPQYNNYYHSRDYSKSFRRQFAELTNPDRFVTNYRQFMNRFIKKTALIKCYTLQGAAGPNTTIYFNHALLDMSIFATLYGLMERLSRAPDITAMMSQIRRHTGIEIPPIDFAGRYVTEPNNINSLNSYFHKLLPYMMNKSPDPTIGRLKGGYYLYVRQALEDFLWNKTKSNTEPPPDARLCVHGHVSDSTLRYVPGKEYLNLDSLYGRPSNNNNGNIHTELFSGINWETTDPDSRLRFFYANVNNPNSIGGSVAPGPAVMTTCPIRPLVHELIADQTIFPYAQYLPVEYQI